LAEKRYLLAENATPRALGRRRTITLEGKAEKSRLEPFATSLIKLRIIEEELFKKS
jgi:hypothetical protein